MAGSKRKHDLAFANNEIVTVMVGPDQVTFPVHKNFLLRKIPHFVKLFGKDAKFKEGMTGVAELADVNPDTWDLIQRWVYYNVLPEIPYPERARVKTITPEELKNAKDTADKLEERYHEIISKAEFWFCAALANDAFEVIRKVHRGMSDRHINRKLAFDSIINLAPHSGFRKFLLKSACVDLMELEKSKRSTFFDAAEGHNSNDKDVLKDDILLHTMTDIAEQRVKLTMKGLLDPNKDWYVDAPTVHGSGNVILL